MGLQSSSLAGDGEHTDGFLKEGNDISSRGGHHVGRDCTHLLQGRPGRVGVGYKTKEHETRSSYVGIYNAYILHGT